MGTSPGVEPTTEQVMHIDPKPAKAGRRDDFDESSTTFLAMLLGA